jgi:hypothetical protein
MSAASRRGEAGSAAAGDAGGAKPDPCRVATVAPTVPGLIARRFALGPGAADAA